MLSVLLSSLLILLAVRLSHCDENRCLAPTDIYPCACYYINHTELSNSCESGTDEISVEILHKALSNLAGKKIEHLKSSSFNGLVIQELYLHDTSTGEVPEFQDSENSLQIMYPVPDSSLLLLLVVGSAHEENQCPAPTDISPCTCSFSDPDEIAVECNGYSINRSPESLPSAVNRLAGRKIKSLSIVNFNMDKTPPGLLNGLVAKELYINSAIIQEIPALKSSENTLEVLSFGETTFMTSTQNFTFRISYLKKLTTLSFTNYALTHGARTLSAGNNWFENGPSSLESLSLYRSNIQLLGDRVFSDLASLKSIDLSNNIIEEVHRSMFPVPATSLDRIDISKNKIKILPEDIFSHMPVLRVVQIYGNLIRVLDERTWKPVWEQLYTFQFDYGPSPLFCDSTIFWTFGLKKPYTLDGQCGKSFREYEGKSLEEIIVEKQGSSSNTN